MWYEGKKVERVEWGPGSVFVPPEMWFHQHFNAGAEPVFFLAIGWGNDKPKIGGGGMFTKTLSRVETRSNTRTRVPTFTRNLRQRWLR